MNVPALSKVNTLDKKVHHNFPTSNTRGANPIDNILKYSPFLLLIILHRNGFKTKNRLKSYLFKMIVGVVMLDVVSKALKVSVKKVRPNGHSKSFPSLHTATCIFGAALLHAELKESYPRISFSGYGLTVVTALLRMYHNKHWFSDILAGALLGTSAYKVTSNINLERGDK